MATHGVKTNTPKHRLVFGGQVRKLREQAGLSQEELAHAAGLHRTYVSSLEGGNRNVGLDNIVALARALNVTAATLLQGV
ncbi:helix-turn-helix domain-containing protein [Streptomyces griseus]|uniref:helix-turn-helix domain-containing protein n=1 Tax=Streptomyces griseus TaxID=1911 RepID=UPI0004CB89C6|nr:helix-turn-helix transcriptional regulator [Streptomyces griseus]